MTKEQQDLTWACLPKDTRKEIVEIYAYHARSGSCPLTNNFELIFGKHNLTSNTEPEEMLHCSRDFVIEKYKTLIENRDGQHKINSPELENWYAGRAVELKELFGDKCLSDPTVFNIPSGGGGMNLKPPAYKLDVKSEQPSVQVEPRFKIGEYVKANSLLVECGEILEISEDGESYLIDDRDGGTWIDESDLEPYTEPETKYIEEEHWGAKLGEYYYYLDDCLEIVKEIESGNYKDNFHWLVGNYFRTHNKAAKACYNIKECFKSIHNLEYE